VSTVEVRRRGALLGGVGVAAAAVAVAYLSRALGTEAALDWVLTALLGALALLFLGGVLDARSALLVADTHGVTVRRGRTWTSWRWAEVAEVDLNPARRLRDGRLRLTSTTGESASLSLGLGARVVADGDPAAALAELSGSPVGRTPVESAPEEALPDDGGPEPEADPTPGHGAWRDPRPLVASGIAALADRLPPRGVRLTSVAARLRGSAVGPVVGPVVDGSLATDRLAEDETVALVLPEREQLRRPDDLGGLADVDDEPRHDVAPEDDVTEAIVVPVVDPVIGPQLLKARARLGLGVEELSERTRIRPRVIAAIEQDDFAACGGDFYARGHLRTLARVLGVEAAPLLAEYDERYAARPQATAVAPAARPAVLPAREPAPRQNPRWSVLVAAVMAVVLAWSVARLLVDSPMPQDRVTSVGVGSGGVRSTGAAGKAVPVLLRATGGGAHVVVRDGNGRIAFTGDVAFGETRRLDVVPPISVESSDGGVEVVVNGEEHGRLGDVGRPAAQVFDGS
jgi:cytoskeleton protein RodZ